MQICCSICKKCYDDSCSSICPHRPSPITIGEVEKVKLNEQERKDLKKQATKFIVNVKRYLALEGVCSELLLQQ